MPNKTRRNLSMLAALTVAGGLAVGAAAPSWADTTPPPATVVAPPTLATVKTRADDAVKVRLTQIDTLVRRVNDVGTDCGHNADLLSQLAADRSGLQSLDSTIQAETVLATARTEFRQIFTDYRIYILETPKSREVIGCDRVSKADAALTTIAGKIQARIDEAKAKGLDTSSAQAAIDDLKSKLGPATTSAGQAASSVIGLHPDKGDSSVQASNTATLEAGRTSLGSALDALKAARTDAHNAVAALKALHGSTTTTAP